MSEGPLGAMVDVLRALALLVLLGLMGLFYRALQAPPAANTSPWGFGTVGAAPDAGPPAAVTYEPALSHIRESAPPVIEGRVAGIYLKRAECAERFVAVDDLCVHRAVHSDPRGEPCVDAFRRGAAPPSVAVGDGSVRWPDTIQYQRHEMTRGSYNVVGNGGRVAAPPSHAGTAPGAASADEELRRLQEQRRAQTAQDQAVRDRRRANANYDARVSRYEREQRWRRMQVND